MDNWTWELRKRKLKEKGWIYNQKEKAWDSPNGNAAWVEDLKLMTYIEFIDYLET